MQTQLTKKAKDFVKSKFSNYTGKFGSEMMFYSLDRFEELIGKLTEAEINKEALLVGAYLHDIGRTVTDTPEHTTEGAKIVEKFFEDNNVQDKELKKIVIDCTLNHGTKAIPETEEGKILRFMEKVVLIDGKHIIMYVDALTKIIGREAAIERTNFKLNGWYDFLGDRKLEFKEKYDECIELINNLEQ